MSEVLIPGKIWNLSGTDYTIPPLSAKGVKNAQEKNLEAFLTLRPILAELDSINATIEQALKGEGGDISDTIQGALEKAKLAQGIEFETSCTTAYEAFRRNYPGVSYDDFLDLPTAHQIKEIAAWVLVGDLSPKKD